MEQVEVYRRLSRTAGLLVFVLLVASIVCLVVGVNIYFVLTLTIWAGGVILIQAYYSWKAARTRAIQIEKASLILTEEQQHCEHDWSKMGSAKAKYSICPKCRLMRHDADGHLFNTKAYGLDEESN